MTPLSDLIARLEARALEEIEYRCTTGHILCYADETGGRSDCQFCDRPLTSDGELFQEAIATLKAREARR